MSTSHYSNLLLGKSKLRVVLVGAGSHVFGLNMLDQFLSPEPCDEIELVLVEPNEEAGRRMASVGVALSGARGKKETVEWVPRLSGTLSKADVVVCSAALQLWSKFERDLPVIARLAPGHLVTEFGGVYGFASTLRQLSLIEGLCREMRVQCPDALLFMISNPMPRLVTAARRWGVRCVGLCTVALVGYRLVASLLGYPEEDYPYVQSRQRFALSSGGTNHLSWLTEATDRQTGEDLLPLIREAWLKKGPHSKSLQAAHLYGALPLSGDDHIQDFLPPTGFERALSHPGHGDAETRRHLQEKMDAFASGQVGWSDVFFHESWEKPGDCVAALCRGGSLVVPTMNLPNYGQVLGLPDGSVVESAVRVDLAGFHAYRSDIPHAALAWNERAVAINEGLVSSFESKSLSSLQDVLKLDPTVADLDRCWDALFEIVKADASLLGNWV